MNFPKKKTLQISAGELEAGQILVGQGKVVSVKPTELDYKILEIETEYGTFYRYRHEPLVRNLEAEEAK